MSQQYPQFQPAPQQAPAPPSTPHRKPRRWLPWAAGVAAFILGLVIGSAGGETATSSSPQPTATATVTAPGAKVTITQPPAPPKATAPATTAAPKPAGVACTGQEDRNAPCTVVVGKSFQLGKHTVLAGWKVSSEFGSMRISGRAKNTGDAASTMFIEVKFLRGDDVVAVVSCSTDELEPGQTQAMSCFSSDDYTTKYARVTAEATF